MKDTQPVSGLDDSNSRLLLNGERVFGNCYYRRKDSPLDKPWTFVGHFVADCGLAVNSEDEFEYRLPAFVGKKDHAIKRQTHGFGPAFPVPDSHHANGQVQYGFNGMTLRDYFAGQALPAKITDAEAFNDRTRESGSNIRINPDNVAATCYRYAEAMVAAREAKP